MSLARDDGHGENPEGLARRALERVHKAEKDAEKRGRARPVIALYVAGESTPVEIPDEVSAVLLSALESVAAGSRVTLLPSRSEMTTAQAAAVLNVSRPHLVALLERGEIGYRKVGTHRRVDVGSLLAFKDRDSARAQAAADALVRLGQEMGFEQ